MRTVSIRQFQQNFHKELKDLPFTITRRGTIIACVLNEEKKSLTEVPTHQPIVKIEKIEDIKHNPLHIAICKHGARVGLCRFGCKS